MRAGKPDQSARRRRSAPVMLTGGTMAAAVLLAVPLILVRAGAFEPGAHRRATANAAMTSAPSPGSDPAYTPLPQASGRPQASGSPAPGKTGGSGKPAAAKPARTPRPPSSPLPHSPRAKLPAANVPPPSVSPPPAARYSFDEIAGPSCAQTSAHYYKPVGYYTDGESGVLSGTGDGVCGGAFDALPMSGSATKDDPTLYALWYFSPGAYKACAISVFIPDDSNHVYVGGAPAHYSVHEANQASTVIAGFHVYQTDELGKWVAGTTVTTGQPFYLRMDNTGQDWVSSTGAPDYAHDAAAQVRVTCTRLSLDGSRVASGVGGGYQLFQGFGGEGAAGEGGYPRQRHAADE